MAEAMDLKILLEQLTNQLGHEIERVSAKAMTTGKFNDPKFVHVLRTGQLLGQAARELDQLPDLPRSAGLVVFDNGKVTGVSLAVYEKWLGL